MWHWCSFSRPCVMVTNNTNGKLESDNSDVLNVSVDNEVCQ